jgi:hypothetical protein
MIWIQIKFKLLIIWIPKMNYLYYLIVNYLNQIIN